MNDAEDVDGKVAGALLEYLRLLDTGHVPDERVREVTRVLAARLRADEREASEATWH